MNTKILLSASALFSGLLGLGLSFLPKELATYYSIDTNLTTHLIIQLLGALYMGFGLMNWMAKGSTIGGIYNKPLVIGNFMHFGVGAITLLKLILSKQELDFTLMILTGFYIIFGISFGFVFMNNPKKVK